MPVTVKICGITNFEDGLAAIDAGADVLGFIFYERSPRFVSIEKAAAIIQKLPPSCRKMGVFVNAPAEEVLRSAEVCGLREFQFHGDESPQYCAGFDSGFSIMKAFQIRDERSLEALPAFRTQAWLLDAWSPGERGGSGEIFNWDLAIKARELGRPCFLAGGLTPDNVQRAIEKVQPHGVDVSSGVESKPGKKDHGKLRSFIRAAKRFG